MQKTLLFLLALACAVAARADDFDLGTHGKLTLTLPKTWKAQGRDLMGQAFDITISPVGDANAQGKLTVIYGKDDSFQDKAKVKAALQSLCEQFISGSVEQKADVKTFTLRQGYGVYASFTDKDLVGKPPVKANYKTMTPGVIYLGNKVSVATTIFADSLTGDEFKQLLAIVESIQLSPPKDDGKLAGATRPVPAL